MDLALNDLPKLIYHKTQTTNNYQDIHLEVRLYATAEDAVDVYNASPREVVCACECLSLYQSVIYMFNIYTHA